MAIIFECWCKQQKLNDESLKNGQILPATNENIMENNNHFRIKTGRCDNLFLKYCVLLDSEFQLYEF